MYIWYTKGWNTSSFSRSFQFISTKLFIKDTHISVEEMRAYIDLSKYTYNGTASTAVHTTHIILT